MNVTLRDYQSESVEKIRMAYAAKYRAPLLVLSTGSGKTVVFCDITERVRAKGNSVVILVHRQELLRQTSDHLARLNVDHGIIAPGHTMTGSPVQIASVQTLARRISHISAPSLLVIDECHHSAAASWKKILDTWTASRVLGVTATPMRLDGKGLGVNSGGYFDSIINGPTTKTLIQRGYLAQPLVYRPPTDIDLRGLRTRGKDYDTKDQESRINKATITGCVISHYKRICPGAPAIAFCATVKHAADVAEMFNAAGISSASLDGSMSSSMRKHRVSSLANGTIRVLTSCDIVSEGTDIPVVTAGILLRPTKSTALYLQQCGRCLRPHQNKTNAIILDHVGNCLHHGMPDDDREWSLSGYVEDKKNKNTEPPVRVCQRCYAVFSISRMSCPQCGASVIKKERKIDQQSGELVLTNADDIAIINQRKQMARQQGMAKSLEDLIEIGKQRGYEKAEGWARHIWNARQVKQNREMAAAF